MLGLNKIKNMEKVSLYDYLGHAAGSDLGQQVATAARQAGVTLGCSIKI